MKVTAVETLLLGEFPFLVWLRVHTDAGIVGTGETFWAPGPVAAYVHDNVAPYLIGKDPRDIELHDRTLGSVYVGARDSGAEVRGNSAVNLALWDILGQAVGEPVWRLLGGRTHASVPLYNTCAGYGHVRATDRHALFERTEDWSLKPGDAAEGPYEDLLAWRYDAGAAGEEPPRRGHPRDEDLAVRHRRRGLDRARASPAGPRPGAGAVRQDPRGRRPRDGDHGRAARALDAAAGAPHRRGAEALRRRLARGADPLQRARRDGRARPAHLDPDRGQRAAGDAAGRSGS